VLHVKCEIPERLSARATCWSVNNEAIVADVLRTELAE